ncbi:MAG: flagellar biosynthesis protein FlhA [Treponemataceae bacterium]|nr:flagellar biosynthesis protein FlhA [Treponemataceae bacterium]
MAEEKSLKKRLNLGKLDLKSQSNLFVAVAVVACVFMLIVPIPAPLLDFFMAINLLLSILILLTTLFITKPTDFTTFPTLLLVSTVYSLAVNVGSTKLILFKGADFNGKMVTAFGEFVVGNGSGMTGIIIGLVIFIILIVIQVFVITKGATRIAEVQARFTLDAMPNKMMAIDAEFNAGTIGEEVAKKRKADLQTEVNFFAAMDGASKFISGSVKAGIFITVINLVAGIIIGMFVNQLSFGESVQIFTKFTVGDGLLSQIPSLLISVATGLIVTRPSGDSEEDDSLGDRLSKEFSLTSLIYFIAGGALIVLAVLPGFPWYILIPMGGILIFFGVQLTSKRKKKAAEAAMEEQKKKESKSTPLSPTSPIVKQDDLSLELGVGLVKLLDPKEGGDLKERIGHIRREFGLELGLVFPSVRMIDNFNLEPTQYSFKIRGVEVGRGSVRPNCYLCMNTGSVTEEISGDETFDPAFGLPAKWISAEDCEKAERAGYSVIDPPTVIATHLTELLRRNADRILGRQEVKAMLDELSKSYSAIVDEVKSKFDGGQIQKVLQLLLKEQVSIRNMVEILETMADYAAITKDPFVLTEKVRQRLGRQICSQYVDEDNTLHVITIDPSFLQTLVASREDLVSGPIAALDPVNHRRWISSLSSYIASVQDKGFLPIVLCPEEARYLIKQSTEREMPNLVVLSVQEIDREIKVESLGEVNVG